MLFPGRCDTTQPGTFCAVLDGQLGERMLVTVEDALGNFVTLDAGNMRDEITGAEVIGPEGGVVTFPGDERYSAIVPEGAFDEPTLFQLTPITDAGVGLGLDLADFPVLTSFDQSKVELIGAVKLDFEGTAQVNIDISVPAPAGADPEDQYIVTKVVNFRGLDEQTMVDEAFFEPEVDLVTTAFTQGFPLIINSGVFGVHHAQECFGYVTGFVTLGDFFNDGYIPAGALGAQLPFPVQSTEPTGFAVPLPCNQTVDVSLLGLDDGLLDSVSVAVPDRRRFRELGRRLTAFDDGTPPNVTETTARPGSTDIDPLSPVQVFFDEPVVIDDATLDLVECETGCGTGDSVAGTWTVSAEGQILTFQPEIRLKYGKTYELRIAGVRDERDNPMTTALTTSFTTFAPTILGTIEGVNARDVVVIDPSTMSVPVGTRLVAIADGRNVGITGDPDSVESGILIYDATSLRPGVFTDLSGKLIAQAITAGIDRALTFVGGPPITVSGSLGSVSFPGPFLFSVDGPGTPSEFGVWRMFSLEGLTLAPQSLTWVATRFLNHSADSFETLNGFNSADPFQAPPPTFLKFIDNQVGVPLGVDAVNSGPTQVAYVANTPFLGIQAISLNNLVDSHEVPQVDGRLTGTFRAVTILGSHVLAVGQDGSSSRLVRIDPQLLGITDTYELGPGVHLSVAGLLDWPSRVVVDGETTVAPRDLAIAPCQSDSLCVLPVSASGAFDGSLLPEGPGKVRLPGGLARGMSGAHEDQLLYVADGTAGLTIVDLSVPGGMRGDGIDERVLGTVAVGEDLAVAVAHYRDAEGRPIVAVASGEDGVFFVQTGEACGGDCGTCRSCEATTGTCVDELALDTGCCERALFYENYRRGLSFSNPRKLFGIALHCVGNRICEDLGPGGSQFDDPDWMLCLNEGLFDRFTSRTPNSECYENAEAVCDQISSSLVGNETQQLRCFSALVWCHDFRDMGDTLASDCGCGTGHDWSAVSEIVANCAANDPVGQFVSFWFVKALSLARGPASGCP